jgi:hypothetical protein
MKQCTNRQQQGKRVKHPRPRIAHHHHHRHRRPRQGMRQHNQRQTKPQHWINRGTPN